ncbi:MAG TPA: hypothetical protein VGA92_05050 [Candidatus Nitrosotenuis sp.]
MFQNHELDISKSNLTTVFSKMREPVCLLGGWAVHLTVNQNFKDVTGRDYIGSRDIDLGFHIDPDWSTTELQNSAFAQSVKTLVDNKFVGCGSRFVKHYDISTLKELTEDQTRKKPMYEMFQLFVDPIVDNIHRDSQKLGFTPLDESLLSHVFNGKKFTSLSGFGGKFMLPTSEILLATKISSVPKRDMVHKRIKDIADIYALSWHSGLKFEDLKQKLQQIVDKVVISDVVSTFTKSDYDAVFNAIGVTQEQVSRVIGELAK